MKNKLSILLVLVLAGCATPMTQQPVVDQKIVQHEKELQKELALKEYYKSQARLHDVAYPVLVNNHDACGDKVAPSIGAFIASAVVTEKEYSKAFKNVFGNGNDAKIVGVVKDGPAYQANIKVGDSVKSIGGEAYSKTTRQGFEEWKRKVKKLGTPGVPLPFRLERDGQSILTEVIPELHCDYPVTVVMEDSLNAYADGTAIYVTKGMMRFTENDDELALIIGHELAHNTMNHISAKTQNFWLGSIFDILAAGYGIDTQGTFGKIGANAYSQEFESEADYVGLYYVAKAGYDISEAPTFWRRIAIEHPGSIKGSYSSTHPSTSERFVNLEHTADEIITKQKNNQELTPNMKKDKDK